MNRRAIVPFISVIFYLVLYGIIVLLKPPSQDSIRELQLSTAEPLRKVIQDQSLPQNFQPNLQNLIPRQNNKKPVSTSNAECLANKKRRGQLPCKILLGLSKHFQLRNCSNSPFLGEQGWKNVFFLYAITGYSISRLLPENGTLFKGSFQLEASLTEIKNSLARSDLSNYVKYLKNAPTVEELRGSLTVFSEQIKNSTELPCKNFINDQVQALLLSFQCLVQPTLEVKTQELTKVLIFWQELSRSLAFFYENSNQESFPLEHMNSWLDHAEFYYYLVGAAIVFIYLLCQIDIKQKVSKQFRHAFPPSNRFKIE